MAAPYWVQGAEDADAFRQVHFFEQDYLRRRFNRRAGTFEATGAAVRLWLTGDLHHYSRYEETAPGAGTLKDGPAAAADPAPDPAHHLRPGRRVPGGRAGAARRS